MPSDLEKAARELLKQVDIHCYTLCPFCGCNLPDHHTWWSLAALESALREQEPTSAHWSEACLVGSHETCARGACGCPCHPRVAAAQPQLERCESRMPVKNYRCELDKGHESDHVNNAWDSEDRWSSAPASPAPSGLCEKHPQRGSAYLVSECPFCKAEAELTALREKNGQLEQDVEERQRSFDLRWNADMRAIKRWQEATGRDKVWPDHADLVVWLLEQDAALREDAQRVVDAYSNQSSNRPMWDEVAALRSRLAQPQKLDVGDSRHPASPKGREMASDGLSTPAQPAAQPEKERKS